MGQIKTPTAFYPDELVVVGIDVADSDGIGDGPRQAEEVAIDERFVLNVMALGVLEPVLVRRRTDGRLEVVEGRRRVRAAREANRRLAARGEDPIRVPVVLRSGSEAELFSIAYAGNEFSRANTPLTRAWLAREYMNRGRSDVDAAARFCVDVATIRNWVALLETAPEVQAAVAAGTIGSTVALEIGRLPFAEQAAALVALLTEASPAPQGEAPQANLFAGGGADADGPDVVCLGSAAPVDAGGRGRVGNLGKSVGGRKHKVRVKDAKAVVRERIGGSTTIEPPSKKVVCAVLGNEQAMQFLNDVDRKDILRWIVGDLDATQHGKLCRVVACVGL